jgi:hypothetical protein
VQYQPSACCIGFGIIESARSQSGSPVAERAAEFGNAWDGLHSNWKANPFTGGVAIDTL